MAQADRHEQTDWNAIALYLKGLGVREVVLISPTPNWRPSLPVIVARRHWSEQQQYLADGLDSTPIATDALMRATYGRSDRLTYISLIQTLCGDAGCLTAAPDATTLLVLDYGHLSPSGSVFIANKILARPLATVFKHAQEDTPTNLNEKMTTTVTFH